MKYLLIFFGSLIISFNSSFASMEQPNIILIMVDDFGHECVQSYGGQTYLTPNLTRMTKEGVQFNNAHSQNICTPSRVQIMTGKYNVRNYTRFATLDQSQKTFGVALKEAGYKTCIIGKWQLGGGAKVIKELGFDEHCLWRIQGANDERYVSPTLLTNGKAEEFKGLYGPRIQQDFAKSFISRNKDKPFFLYYPMTLPHYPFQPTPDSNDWDPNRDPYFNDTIYFKDMVHYLDKLVGELIDFTIDEGIDKNTIIIFTSDNGTDHRITSYKNDIPIKGAKGQMTQFATHVPFIVKWPNIISKHFTTDALIDFSDIYETLLDVAQIDKGQFQSNQRDGFSFLPILEKKSDSTRSHSYCWYMERTDMTDIKSFIQNINYKLHHDGRFINKSKDPFEKNPLTEQSLSEDERLLKNHFAEQMNYYNNLRPERIPYQNSQRINLPGKLEVEMYDLGLPSITYYDTTKGNSKKGFWRRDDVDITSSKGRHYVTNTEETEWLEYSIFSKNSNQCQISINYFGNKAGEIYFEINGKLATEVINLPKSNSLKPINYKSKEKISIPKGNSILRLYIKEGGINLDSIIFSS